MSKLKSGLYKSNSPVWFDILVTPTQVVVLDSDGLPIKIEQNIDIVSWQNDRYLDGRIYTFTPHDET
jgi:hypothetical protein